MEKYIHLWKLMFETTEKVKNWHARTQPIARTGGTDVTMSQIRVLSCVFFAKKSGIRVKEISEELGITPGAVSQIVEALVRRGYLSRRNNENDRRSVWITLSPFGEEIRTTLDKTFSDLFYELTKTIPPEKVDAFVEVLIIMKDKINHYKPGESNEK